MVTEKRRSDRKRMQFRVEYWKANESGRKIRAEGVNISLGGVGLKLREPVKDGDALCMKIKKGLLQKPIEARGRIVWQDALDSFGKVTAGVKFAEAQWAQIEEMIYG